jgi:beta-lactamase family protein
MGGRQPARMRQRAAAMALAAALAAGLVAGLAGGQPARAAGGQAGESQAGRQADQAQAGRQADQAQAGGRADPGQAPLVTPPVPEARRAICVSAAHPKLATRMARNITAAVHGRHSAVGLTVADPGLRLACRLDRASHFYAASVIKVTIISALLRKIGGRPRMTRRQRSLAWAMITRSSNSAATALWDEVGLRHLRRFLALARMTHTRLDWGAWGLTQITAQDELALLKLLVTPGKVLSTASRHYVLYLMAHVVRSQRWGVPAGAPRGVTVHVKDGWLPYPGNSDWRINSIGAFHGRGAAYQMAVLTAGSPSMSYGIATIQAAARVINRDLREA